VKELIKKALTDKATRNKAGLKRLALASSAQMLAWGAPTPI